MNGDEMTGFMACAESTISREVQLELSRNNDKPVISSPIDLYPRRSHGRHRRRTDKVEKAQGGMR